MSAIPGNVIIMFWGLMYYVPLINLCPLSRSMCLTIEQCSCDKFVEKMLYLAYSSLRHGHQKAPNGEYDWKGTLLCLLKALYYA